MPIRGFIVDPPKDLTEESVRETAKKMLAALKGNDKEQQEQPDKGQSAPESNDAEDTSQEAQ